MRLRELHVEILECVLVIISIGQLGKAVSWLLSPLIVRLLDMLPGGASMINQMLLGEIIQCGLILAIIWFFWRYGHKRSWQALGLQKSQDAHWLIWAIGNGLLLLVIMLMFSLLLSLLLPNGLPPQNVAAIITTAQTPWEKLVPIIVTGILAPVSEELLFRGFIYHSLRLKFTIPISILLTAAVFGCMHGDLLRMLPLMLGGIWLNILYVKTDSLYVPMVAHSVWNLCMTAIIYLT